MTLEIMTDNFPEETSWQLENSIGTVLYSDSNYFDVNSIYTYPNEVPNNDCYTLTIHDSYGDGICCNHASSNTGLQKSKLRGRIC